MKVVILYRPESEYARGVEMFLHDFQSRHADIKLEVVNIDSREGIALSSLYDLMRHPTILAMANDGVLLKSWEGNDLPRLDEVAAYGYSM